mmetsp:Transcript_21101/g.25938  ORF Transcript_21101/g.25938 Transcript_21101/m.25938 type:complete len:289 (-) Transcript_21101:253-1119(-)
MNRPQHQQVATLPSFSSVGGIVVRGMGNFAKKHKVISGSYILGILFILLVGSGTKLSVDQAKRYDSIMNTIDIQAEYEASHRYAETLHAYRATKGWFSCDSLCQRNKQRMERAEAILQDVRREGYARMSDAKSVAGVFSEVGVDEVKDSFWGYFGAGKQFAKRQSMWDALFMGMRSMKRDESMIEYMLQMLMNLLINFSIGLIGALVVFVFGLWSIIKSYQPNPLTAVLFFIGASSAAFAFVSTYLFAMFGAAAGGVYGLAKVAESNARLQNGGGGRRQNVQNHAHHS